MNLGLVTHLLPASVCSSVKWSLTEPRCLESMKCSVKGPPVTFPRRQLYKPAAFSQTQSSQVSILFSLPGTPPPCKLIMAFKSPSLSLPPLPVHLPPGQNSLLKASNHIQTSDPGMTLPLCSLYIPAGLSFRGHLSPAWNTHGVLRADPWCPWTPLITSSNGFFCLPHVRTLA